MRRTRLGAVERESAFLADIVREAEDVGVFTKGVTFVDFASNRLISKAVIKSLESIGEATKNLTPALKKRHPRIEWRKVAAFRDLSIHHYWDVDYAIVWDVVKSHVPLLLDVIKKELEGRALS